MLQRFTHKTIICLGMFSVVFFTSSSEITAATIADFKVPENFRFTKDVTYGTTTRPDVSYLQNILNMSTSTRVATSGIGSLRTPSNYYGIKTREAVDRFQKIFAKDIEFEKSLSTSTATSTTIISSSTLDVYTRRVLNKLIIIYSGDRRQYYEYVNTGAVAPTNEERIVPKVVQTESEPPQSSGSNTQNPQNTQNTQKTSKNSNSDSDGGSSLPLPTKPYVLIYEGKKFIFEYSPQGQILKAIGGDELVNQVFSFTPAGLVGSLFGLGSDDDTFTKEEGEAAGAAGAAAAAAGAAGAASVLLNFGGRSTAMTTCTCSLNFLIYVQDVRGTVLPLIYQPGATVLYMQYAPTSGVWMLGNYVTGGTCLIYSGNSCVTGGTPVGTMSQLGTSLSI